MKIFLQLPLAMILFTFGGRATAATHLHAKRDAAWRAEIREKLHVPAVLPELDVKTWSTFSPAKGVKAERVTYNTADGMIVPAIVYMPDPMPPGKLPGIVVVNGHGSDKFGWYAFWSGIEFARAGGVVVTYDMIGEGERNIDKKSMANAHDATPMEYGLRLAGLMQVDAMQAVTYLMQQKSVDTKRIALLGFSMGSFVAGITGAIDPRIHAVVLSGGGIYGDAGSYWDRGTKPCQVPASRALLEFMPAEERGAILYTLNADRGPMLVMNGTADNVMDIAHSGVDWLAKTRVKTIALHGSEENMFTSIIYPEIGHRPSWVDRDGFLWLEDHIHFATWTRAQIENAPLTHISAWAKTNDVAIAAGPLDEVKEGGVMAVGEDVPGVKREDLMVLPDAEWERLKDRLVFEAWMEKIKSQYPPE